MIGPPSTKPCSSSGSNVEGDRRDAETLRESPFVGTTNMDSIDRTRDSQQGGLTRLRYRRGGGAIVFRARGNTHQRAAGRVNLGRDKNAGVAQVGTRSHQRAGGRPKQCLPADQTVQIGGFRFDKSEYRADNALRAAAGGTITATVPAGVAGRFYPGFIFYDGGGQEAVAIHVRGERRGVAVADWDDNNQHLFFLTEPVELKAGEEIQLRASDVSGSYRTEDLVLLREKPSPGRRDTSSARLPPRRIGLPGSPVGPRSVPWSIREANRRTLQQVTEPQAISNHRVELPDVQAGSDACDIASPE